MALDYDIKLFAMGGTIDKVAYCHDHIEVVDPQAIKILEASNVSVRVATESLVKKDSLELTPEDRALLLRAVKAEPCERIIVTHGTDTLHETAKVLANEPADKTIVFTGAMLPARFIDSDAAFNVGGAIIAVQILPPGLYLVMHGRIFDARKIVKDREQLKFNGEIVASA